MVFAKPGQQQDAAGVPFDNAASGLTATDLQAAIDETEGRIDTLEGAPPAHDLGGAEHNADTLANLNSKVSDGTLIDTGDSRLSDDRTASGLRTATTVVDIATAAAPTAGQVLEATSGTDAAWATPSGGGGSAVIVEDEGTPLTTDVKKMNFAGAGVTVTEPVTDEVLITIPGGGGSAGEQGAVQARRTTAYVTTASFADVTLDATDVENDVNVVEHDGTNTDRITLKETGLHRVTYHGICSEPNGSASNLNVESRVRVDDTTVIDGSEDITTVFDDSSIEGDFHDDAISGSFLYEATADEQITLQIRHVDLGASGDTSSVTDIIFTAVRLSGEKGDDGDTGPAGAGSAESDMQEASESTETSITSTTFVDLDSVTLTTSNTASKDYAIAFNGAFRGGNNQTITIQLVVDGVVQAKTIRPGATTGTTKPINLGTIGKGASLATGKVIKVQWKVSGSTAFADERCITIHGVS